MQQEKNHIYTSKLNNIFGIIKIFRLLLNNGVQFDGLVQDCCNSNALAMGFCSIALSHSHVYAYVSGQWPI